MPPKHAGIIVEKVNHSIACDRGTLPQAYVYAAGMGATRDLLRRMYLIHKRGETIAHVQNTNSQYPPRR